MYFWDFVLVKGKSWTVKKEMQLRKMVEAGCNAYEIAEKLKRNPNAVYEKAKRLGLVVIISRKSGKIVTTNLKLRLWNRKNDKMVTLFSTLCC
jgi:hypothetical protein